MQCIYRLFRSRLVVVQCLLILLSYLLVPTAHAQVLQFPQGEFPLTNHSISSVDINEILSGGPPKDGIPAIDKPTFLSIEDASNWLDEREPVIAVQLDGAARAYPLQILMYHEIVNDMLAETPLAVTFCPLCNASIVFKRQIEAADASRAQVEGSNPVETQILDFGTTGRLRKSDLVMYDRQTESWWQQFTGTGIIGDLTNITLERVRSQIVSFKAFSEAFPDGDVLSRETGFSRPYGNNPYRGYDDIDSNPFLYDGEIDSRLPPMERVLSLGSSTTHLLPLSALTDTPILNLEIESTPTVVLGASMAASALDKAEIAASRAIPAAAAFDATVNGRTLTFSLRDDTVVDDQSGSIWNAFGRSTAGSMAGTQLQQLDQGVHFAFAWLAFDPEATIIDAENIGR